MTAARAPRADALRNRRRVLAAAEEVFAGRGPSVPTEEVARTAGVGIGTVFRHFPTKAALVRAVVEERLRRFAAEADRLVAADDPGEAFWTLLRRVVEVAAGTRAFAGAVDLREALGPAREQLARALGVLLKRAQDAGAVRADVAVPELVALIGATAGVAGEAPDGTALRDRVLAIAVDGLRPGRRGDGLS